MSMLFSPWMFGDLELPNRLVRSATWEGLADENGFIDERMVRMYAELARGGVGLIISGYAYVRPDGQDLPWQMGIHTDAHIDGLAKVTDAVHAEGGRVIVQIHHAGAQSSRKGITGDDLVAPSAVAYAKNGLTPRALLAEEIPELVAAYADAARRAKNAGFDGVQIHGAHGYLINSFLSPARNRREDDYGGSLENRARFGTEVIHAVRAELGPGVPISIKLNAGDFVEGGLVPDDSLAAAKLFVAEGADHIELSGGVPEAEGMGAVRRFIDSRDKEAYLRDYAARFAPELSVPVGTVGGIRSFDIAEDIVASGDAVTVSLSRPLICEPDLPARWGRGDRARARCKSDGGCFVPGLKGQGIRCTAFPKDKS